MEPGFEIFGVVYPVVERWRVADPVLVREVTGMEWLEFAEAAERMSLEEGMGGEGGVDQIVLAGMIAVSYWQANPRMTRKQVVRFMEQLPLEAVTMVGEPDEPDDEPVEGEEGADASPPDDSGVKSPTTPDTSTTSRAEPSVVVTRGDSGEPGWDTGSPE